MKERRSKPFFVTMKDYRVISTASLIFLTVCQWQFLMWVFTFNLETISPGGGVLATGIQGGLAISYRFVFQFASYNTLSSWGSPQYNPTDEPQSRQPRFDRVDDRADSSPSTRTPPNY